MDAPRVLVTGGAGYIGSHTAKLLRSEGIEPVVYDNLTTGNRSSVRWGPFVEGDVLDSSCLIEVIEKYAPDAVIHFAASAYVGESVQNPAKYYNNRHFGRRRDGRCRHGKRLPFGRTAQSGRQHRDSR